MDKFELDGIIKSLDDNSSKDDAYFEFKIDEQDSYIRANEDGLFQFYKQLLKSIKLFEDRKANKSKTISITGGDWLDGDDNYNYIEPIYEFRKDIKTKEHYNESWKDKIFKLGCPSVLVLLRISVLVGLVNIII